MADDENLQNESTEPTKAPVAPVPEARADAPAEDLTTDVEAPVDGPGVDELVGQVSERTGSTGAASKDAASKDAAPQDAAPQDASSKEVASIAPEHGSADSAGSGVNAANSPLTAVGLGLLPENFQSAVSTALHFYAPALPPLPPLEPERDSSRDDTASAGSSRRRNRRRGAGEDRKDNDIAEPPARKRQVEQITEPQRIKGSTRLEAKKQRRRDGREAGRRRPVVTEAEFLARREAVDRAMIVRSKSGRIQIGVLEDKVLVEHYVARNQDASLIGNVYLGRVQNVLPSMEAAFVDIGRGRNAVLYSGEVDWDAAETGNQPRRIELALKSGDKVLVQVTKDPVGHKGARLTSQISLPGRYLVYVPGGAMNGISRKLPDTERARLKRILKEVLPESSGVIVRTAAEGATEDQLTRDVQRLTSQWDHISKNIESMQAPALLHSEPDLLVKIIRDVFNEDFTRLVIQGDEAQRTIEGYLEAVAPDLLERVERYDGDGDPFDDHRITEQIEKALDRKVWLPSGGSLVIDRTEAMTVVDVNTGKFVGSGGNLEETVTKNNLEAAEEIVRQLRLRDIGGIIVVDFIDMVLESNRDLVLRRLIECLSRDRTKHQVAEVTSLGLVQMTRKKLGLGLLETFSEACDVCAGRGVVVHHDPVVKHRPSSGNGNGNGNGNNGNGNRRGRNNSSSSSAPSPSGSTAGSGSTHVITEGVKSALAQIAASTIASTGDDAIDAAAFEAAAAEAAAEVTAPDTSSASTSERPKKQRKKRDSGSRNNAKSGQRSTPPVARDEKDMLLDSVLSALPEPKAPGQGRARRRVTTAGLTAGTAVLPTASDD